MAMSNFMASREKQQIAFLLCQTYNHQHPTPNLQRGYAVSAYYVPALGIMRYTDPIAVGITRDTTIRANHKPSVRYRVRVYPKD